MRNSRKLLRDALQVKGYETVETENGGRSGCGLRSRAPAGAYPDGYPDAWHQRVRSARAACALIPLRAPFPSSP